MHHYAAFHLDNDCLPKYLFTGIQNEKGYTNCGDPNEVPQSSILIIDIKSFFRNRSTVQFGTSIMYNGPKLIKSNRLEDSISIK